MLVLVPGAARAEEGHALLDGEVLGKRVVVRYRPGSLAGAHAESVATAAERDLDRIGRTLAVEVKGPFTLWVYDDEHELHEITGNQRAGAFSAGADVHLPFDNAQTRVHELVHVVQHQLPRSGDEPRGLAYHEGLANAVLEHVHGVHVHAYAAVHARAGQIPPISEPLGAPDFYAWMREHRGVDWYDVSGSWMRFLLDAYGPQKLVRYAQGTPARKAFGADVETLETRWRKLLEAWPVRPEVETLVRARDGEDVDFTTFVRGVPQDVLGALEDWVSLGDAELHPDEPANWRREGDGLVGTQGGDAWTACELGDETYRDCVFHAVVRTPAACPIQVRIGPDHQVMLVNGTFLYRADNTSVAHSPSPALTPDRRRTEFYVLRRGARVEVWVDGVKALVAPGVRGAFRVGVGLHRGQAVFEELRVRRL